jgi:uncharacterized membrane protein HdeD (DUF308 family)
MKTRLFAALAILSLLFGTAALVAPAHASVAGSVFENNGNQN